jgi:hypothetical protein
MDLPQPAFRSINYSIAQLQIACWVCDGLTRVVAVALPVSHEVTEEVEEERHVAGWQTVCGNALLFHISQLSKKAQRRLIRLAPGFGLAWSGATQESHWLNHCEHCHALLDDHELHCEPGNTFVPSSEAQGSNIRLIKIHEPFEASANGYSLEPEYLPFTRSA